MSHTPVPPVALPQGRIHLSSASGLTLRLNRTFMLGPDALPVTVPRLEVLSRPGAVPTGPRRFGVRAGSFSGQATPSELNELARVLNDGPVQLRLDSATGPFLTIQAVSITPARDGPTPRVDVTFEALHPFWQGHTASTSSGVINRNATRSVTVGGSAPVSPLVTLTGVSGGTVNPRLVNETNGTSMAYLDTLNVGNILIADTAELTAYRSTVSVIAAMDAGFAVGFRLDPGPNVIKLETTSGNCNVLLTWRDQFI